MQDFDVFLSYHWRDHAPVEALAQRLRSAGLQVFLDRWYLTPGTNWLRALETNLARCAAVAVCTGSEMGPWQQREAYAALERQATAERNGNTFPVIPVLLPNAEAPLGFLSQNTWVDLRERADDPQRLEVLVRAIRGEPPGPALQTSIAQTLAIVCPYRGLLHFREEDAAFFRGRTAAIAQLVEAVAREHLVAVVGASGSGKSSVVRAGLVPVLRGRRENPWEIVTLVPGDRPLYNLSATLLPLLEPEMSEVTRLGEIQRLADQLETGAIRLRDVVQRVLALQPGTQHLLLVVDQWEELFTLTENTQQRQCFIDNVLEATGKSALNVVLTLRGDYFGRAVTSHRELSDRLQGAQINLGPMTEAELRQAIVEPAAQVGLEFEPNLVELILEQAVGEPGHLPLLEFVLRELWEQRQGRVMHRQAYDSMGQLEGAIAQRAEALYDELTRNDPQAAQRIRSIILRLVRPGEGEQDTRRRALLVDFDTPTAKLVETLASKRLLVSSASSGSQSPTVEVAHEALIAHWSRLREWVGTDRQFMTWRQHLDDEAAEWENKKRSNGLLLQGLRLAEARDWMKRRRDDLSSRECAFIEASARRRKLVVGGMSAVAGIAVTAVLGFGIVANQERGRADEARERAEDLIEYMVFDLRDVFALLDRPDLMTGINDQVTGYYEKLGDGSSPDVQRRRAVGLINQGSTLAALGKLDAARKAYRQSLAIAERLAKTVPSNTGWQRDLSVSYSKLGDMEVSAGNLDAARKAYEQDLPIAEQLAKTHPSDTELQRDLSVSYNKLGNVELAAGKLDAARRAYEQALMIRQQLAKANSSDTELRRDLSVSYEKLGDVELPVGALDAARKAYEQALTIRQQLAKADFSDTELQFDLSVGYEKLGNVELRAGAFSAARKAYEQALTIRQQLAKANSSNTEFQRALSVSYSKLGNVELAAGNLNAARKAYEEDLPIAEQLAKAAPSSIERQRDLFVTYSQLGDVISKEGKPAEALPHFEKARDIIEILVEGNPTNATWKSDLESVQARITELRSAASTR